jgi:hypothetical protein
MTEEDIITAADVMVRAEYMVEVIIRFTEVGITEEDMVAIMVVATGGVVCLDGAAMVEDMPIIVAIQPSIAHAT